MSEKFETARYKIIRFFQRDPEGRQVMKSGLTLEQAQAWCRDPETSSSTATKTAGVRRTKNLGPWFDGYELERN